MRIIILFALFQTQFLLHGQMTICGNKSYPPLTFSATVKEKLEIDLTAAKATYEKDVKMLKPSYGMAGDWHIWAGMMRPLRYLPKGFCCIHTMPICSDTEATDI
ncbi:MAG: hypothetical protein IPJ13_16365 [Saprospiraceae bacterium]|nr:hypothetical protein [Saprospiraceae bacterium]